MVIVPPNPFRRRRRKAPQAFHPGLTIIQVVALGNPSTFVVLVTSGEFVFDELHVPTAFMAMTGNGIMESCISVETYGNNWMELEFPARVLQGAAWELVGPIQGVTPAIAWPQAGAVTV